MTNGVGHLHHPVILKKRKTKNKLNWLIKSSRGRRLKNQNYKILKFETDSAGFTGSLSSLSDSPEQHQPFLVAN